MGKALSDGAVRQFQERGFFFPVPVLSEQEVADFRKKLEAVEAANGGALKPEQRNKSHLLFKWIDDLIRDPRILDPIEDLIGPDILCWNTLFWIKEPETGSYVGWHQDSHYWGLDGGTVVSAWLALSPAGIDEGCMRVMPGSHLAPALPHADLYKEENMLTRGQEISDGVDEAQAVPMPLAPGEMSFHNIATAHASAPNNGRDRRIGLSMHFMPPHTRQIVGKWDSAALVRGQDRYVNFEHTPRPNKDFDPETVPFHGRAAGAVRDILYHGAENQTGKL